MLHIPVCHSGEERHVDAAQREDRPEKEPEAVRAAPSLSQSLAGGADALGPAQVRHQPEEGRLFQL